MTNLDLYFENHQESLKFHHGSMHWKVLDRKKSKLFAQICPTANLDFFSKFVSNRNFTFQAKTAKWPLFFFFQREKMKL